LERAGWTFWRCWGANFYRDQKRVLADLFETLEEMKIEPIGDTLERFSGHVEYRELCGMTEEPTEEGIAVEVDTEQDGGTETESEILKAEADKEAQIPNGSLQLRPVKVIVRRRGIRGKQQTLGWGPKEKHALHNPSWRESEHSSEAAYKTVAAQTISVCINDTVSYCFVGVENEVKTVQIVTGPNQPSMGIINANAPVAKALIGSNVGEEVEVRLPTGARLIRILKIEKAV
jgi:hypothetical protein